jgi:hypothetical protein
LCLNSRLEKPINAKNKVNSPKCSISNFLASKPKQGIASNVGIKTERTLQMLFFLIDKVTPKL